MERTSLFILGMHRTGTSALARVLGLRGARLPHKVLPANAGNVHGYWEPDAVVALNDRVLASFDLSWHDPAAAMRLPEMPEAYAEFMPEARRILQEDFGDTALSVVKDPRCTLLQPFWSAVLQAEGVRPAWITMMRPWREVVDSLERRDGGSAEVAAWVYVGYGLAAAEAVARGATCVTYAQLIGNWRGTTDRIASEQGVQWPQPPDEAAIRDYLQHAIPRTADPRVPEPIAGWAEVVWAWFDRAAHGERPPLAVLDAVRSGFADSTRLAGLLLGDRAERLFAAQEAERAARGERDNALQIYHDTDARLRATQSDFEVMTAELEARLRKVQDDFEVTTADLGVRLRRTQDDYVVRDRECADLRHELAEVTRQAESASREAESVREQADALRRELAVVLGSRSWRVTRPLRYVTRLVHGGQAEDPHALQPTLPPAPALVHAMHRSAATRVRHAPTHAALRRFLDAEFGEGVSTDVIARIDRFRLPIPTEDVRGSARLECSDEEVVAWARAIAVRAPIAATDDAPVVSIVLPVYNQAPFTLACLDALLAHRSHHRFEVLVGDDASTDATAIALAVPMTGVRHVRHAENLGFVRNCNATAAQARGRYVVFLNNDTLVLPGWLDELIATLESEPGIGLAGSKLVYPDGRLQECGAIVWRDGSAWNYGRLADPRQPEFCYRRDVDYVSGASIALRRETWQQLGGFDELFAPAYAEDADLAFRVRAHGLRTMVQPQSQLLHFEGISSGTDLGSGAKAYQTDNLRKLRARWADVLEGHRDNAVEPELEKERAVQRRVLFVDKCTPTPNEDAGSVVVVEILKAMVDVGCKVTFVPEDNFAHVGEPTRALQRLGIEPIYHPAYSRMASFVAARKDPFDVVFLHRFEVGEKHLDLLRRRYPGARVLFLNADLHSLRELREAELSGDAAALAAAHRTRDREMIVVSKVDVALVHSEYERDLLQAACPGKEIVLFPLVHDPAEVVAPLAGREGLCFVGGFRHPPNVDAIRWFVESAWPRVLEAVPDARLHIVGSHMPQDIRALGQVPGVRAVGFVEDLDAFLSNRRVTIAPLRYGAGAKGKVAASLAQGVPVVCTSVATEGMLLEPGDVLADDEPDALADHVIALLRDDALWDRLSKAGLDYARRVTSRSSARERLRAVLDAL